MKAVIVTWEAGGGAQMATGLGRLLADAGHSVRIIGPAAAAERAAAAGCGHRPLPPEAEFRPGVRGEHQREVLNEIFHGAGPAQALREECAAEPADVVVVDYLMRSAATASQELPSASALLVHTIASFHQGDSPESVTGALVRRADGVISAVPREFDDWSAPPPNVVHVGPITERPAQPAAKADDDHRRLVVVSLGSQLMDQENALNRIARALSTMPVRGLVLTGEVDPSRVHGSANVTVERYVPHGALLPHAALVVTHAGTGTLMAAFSAGLPVLCVPLGRDQPQNAQRVADLGLGRAIAPDAQPEQIAAAIADLLQSPSCRERAAAMQETIARYAGGAPAVHVLERLAAGDRSPPPGG